jgi:hypothetical protein
MRQPLLGRHMGHRKMPYRYFLIILHCLHFLSYKVRANMRCAKVIKSDHFSARTSEFEMAGDCAGP